MDKQAYYSAATIGRKSREMLRAVLDLRQKRDWAFDPGRAALLVLDLQEYFLDPGSHAHVPSGPAIIPGVNALVRAFRGSKRPVFITRHLNTPGDAGLMAAWWKDLITEENPLSVLAPELDASGLPVIRKTRYDAFFGTDLEAALHSRRAGQVVVCGVLAHLCCETTARSAFMHGFEPFFAVDGTADYNQAFHAATLLNLSHGFATPILIDEILAAFGGEP
jgi:isochorismate hydrolase